MVDKLTAAQRSVNMSRIRSEGMKPELIVRRAAHALGYRFRLHRGDLPGKPDLVFPARRKVIFVNGCFWHQHEDPLCLDGRLPKSRPEYWRPKLQRNVERDMVHIAALKAEGWKVLVIWECGTKDAATLASMLRRFLV
jgi:DNA mismatch endonuclease (patch repair protein)